MVAEVLTIEIMPSMGLRRIYITGLDILMEAYVLCTPVIQRVLMQKIFWCGNGESNPLKGQGRSSPDFSGVPLSSTYLSPEASAWLFPKEAGPVTSSVHRGTAHSAPPVRKVTPGRTACSKMLLPKWNAERECLSESEPSALNSSPVAFFRLQCCCLLTR